MVEWAAGIDMSTNITIYIHLIAENNTANITIYLHLVTELIRNKTGAFNCNNQSECFLLGCDKVRSNDQSTEEQKRHHTIKSPTRNSRKRKAWYAHCQDLHGYAGRLHITKATSPPPPLPPPPGQPPNPMMHLMPHICYKLWISLTWQSWIVYLSCVSSPSQHRHGGSSRCLMHDKMLTLNSN